MTVKFSGKCSWFGGPADTGVAPDEGLAFIYSAEEAPWLFLASQPEGTTGLARRLAADDVPYVACRWDYDVTPKDMLKQKSPRALVKAKGKKRLAWPADWGPHEDTGRAADLSPFLMKALGIETDDEVEVIYPAPKRKGKKHASVSKAGKSSAARRDARRSAGKQHTRHSKKSRSGIRKGRQARKASRA